MPTYMSSNILALFLSRRIAFDPSAFAGYFQVPLKFNEHTNDLGIQRTPRVDNRDVQ